MNAQLDAELKAERDKNKENAALKEGKVAKTIDRHERLIKELKVKNAALSAENEGLKGKLKAHKLEGERMEKEIELHKEMEQQWKEKEQHAVEREKEQEKNDDQVL
jgi:hypothetical protein